MPNDSVMRAEPRFRWTPHRDAILRAHWLDWSLSRLALEIGCRKRALYVRAGWLGLGLRDPVARAVAQGDPPRRGAVTLPRLGAGLP